MGEKISVVINTLNSEQYLERVLRSVAELDEIVICDMGSTDATLAIAERFHCRVVTHPPTGKKQHGAPDAPKNFPAEHLCPVHKEVIGGFDHVAVGNQITVFPIIDNHSKNHKKTCRTDRNNEIVPIDAQKEMDGNNANQGQESPQEVNHNDMIDLKILKIGIGEQPT